MASVIIIKKLNIIIKKLKEKSPKIHLTNHTGSKSHRVMPLVVIILRDGHTHTQHTHTHRHTHTHTDTHTHTNAANKCNFKKAGGCLV